ncbi:MAG: ATP-binding cassette domain-containing protein [Actinobacteria bacterium]|nr:ATP-binding cassette domain-containing protein [Actinomycetota bacterium]
MSAVISAENLTKKYGDLVAVDHASFDIPAGAITGFVGPNGAGKTTTIRMLLGLVRPSTGTARILEHSIAEPESYLPYVGAMIEGPAFYPALSGRENLRVLARLGDFPYTRVEELLLLVGLADRATSKFKTYSLGMKQRLGIAAALLPNPKVLILDEPVNGLDPAGIHEVRNLLRSLADSGISIFVSSHILSELEVIADYLVVVDHGKVLFQGATKELLAAHKPRLAVKGSAPADITILQELAQKAGYSSDLINDQLVIVAPESFAGELNKSAFDRGIVLTQLQITRPTLEESFFEITGGEG